MMFKGNLRILVQKKGDLHAYHSHPVSTSYVSVNPRPSWNISVIKTGGCRDQLQEF